MHALQELPGRVRVRGDPARTQVLDARLAGEGEPLLDAREKPFARPAALRVMLPAIMDS